MESKINYIPGDPLLIQNIVAQLKSQGVFDQFRKECISDVDTKPAYQNLCHRVDGEVECYLSDVKLVPDLNKNQLRESIRKYINERTFVDSGITRIVDQLVNPRINTVLVPKVADIVCNYLGIEKIDFEMSNNCRNKSNEITGEYNKVPLGKSGVSISKDPKLLDQNYVTCGEDVKSEYNTSKVKNQPKELDYGENLASEPHIKNEPNKNEETNRYIGNVSTARKHGVDTCSDIDSDDDDISPPYEPHQKSDVESAESDYSMDVQGDDVTELVNIKTEVENDKINLNMVNICGEESNDAINSSLVFEANRDVSCVDIPSTPTINYETSDENEDTFSRKNIEPFEQMRDQSGRPDEISHIPKGTIRNHVAKDEDLRKKKETDKLACQRKNESPKYRDRKHSAHRKDLSKSSVRREKDHHISIKEKDRSRDQGKTHSSKYKTDKTDRRDRSTDKTKEKDSTRKSSTNEKRKTDEKNSRKDNLKDDRKKRSSISSKHGSDKDRRKNKHSKEENSNVKKNMSQCSEDRKIRSDRRSSDRDSNGPSSSSRHSSHRSSSKNDKERQSKCRHSSSSSSSSHKSKKTTENGDRVRSEEMDADSTKSDDPSKDPNFINEDPSKDTNSMNVNLSKDTNPMNLDLSKVTNFMKVDSSKVANSMNVDSSRDTNSMNVNSSRDTNSMNVDSIDQRIDERAPTESTKKPKIARNASDILRIIELRKQYQEKMKLTQQGKENTDSEFGNKSEFSEKSVLGKRFSMNTLKESIDNCLSNKYDKNVESENGVERPIDLLNNSHDKIKVKIRKVDPDFKLMNGSCLIASPNGEDETLLISNELCTNTVDGNVNNNYVRTGGTGYSISKTPIEAVQSHCYIKEGCLKINGCSTNIVKSFPYLKNEPCQETKDESQYEISTKENDWKSRLIRDIGDVHYLESSEQYAEFKEFVAKTIQEAEQIYLENFSIFIKCSERYDEVLRSKLVAIVKREGKVPLLPSPIKYNSEILSNAEGNDRSIMMRIKKTVTGSECAVSSNQNLEEVNTTYDAVTYSMKGVPAVVNELNPSYNVTHGGSQQMDITKRKTFGIKRKLTYGSKINKGSDVHDKCMDDNSKSSGGNVDVCHGIEANYEEEASKITGALHLSESSNLKNPKRDTGSKFDNGIDSKRRQFYYDKGDLYKPHRPFLASSRRFRNLNPD